MSQELEAKLQKAMQEAELARARSAESNRCLDAIVFSDLTLVEKMGLISHMRTANGVTGEQWGSAAHHAKALSVSPERARKIMRELVKDGYLDLIEPGGGRQTNLVVLNKAWMEERLTAYLDYRKSRKAPPSKMTPVKSDGGQTPVKSDGAPPSEMTGHPRQKLPGTPVRNDRESFYRSSDGSADGSPHPGGTPRLGFGGTPQLPEADTPCTSGDGGGRELQMQQTQPKVSISKNGIPWVEPAFLPRRHAQAVWYDTRNGQLAVVNNDRGKAFYKTLLDLGHSHAVIAAGIQAASAKAPKTSARDGGLEALIRSYCGYAAEKEAKGQAAPAWASYKGGLATP